MSSEYLEKNYSFFKAHLDEYLGDPLKVDKFAVFFEEELKNTFDTFEAAVRYAARTFSRDFIVQQITNAKKPDAYFAWHNVNFDQAVATGSTGE